MKDDEISCPYVWILYVNYGKMRAALEGPGFESSQMGFFLWGVSMFSRCLCGHTPKVQNMHRVKLPGNFKLSISEASEYEWLSVSLC